jgi:hypothetical protein
MGIAMHSAEARHPRDVEKVSATLELENVKSTITEMLEIALLNIFEHLPWWVYSQIATLYSWLSPSPPLPIKIFRFLV